MQKINLKFWFGIFLFVTPCFAQTMPPDTVDIPIGATVQITWTAPPDTDVVKYHLFFTGIDSAYLESVNITRWWSNDSCMYLYKHALKLGRGFADMTAVDRSGNESLPSNKAYYRIYDPRPGAPQFIMLKVIK